MISHYAEIAEFGTRNVITVKRGILHNLAEMKKQQQYRPNYLIIVKLQMRRPREINSIFKSGCFEKGGGGSPSHLF